jgi:hypothetical protein
MSPKPAQQQQQFDPVKYKQTTREQWQTAVEPWHRWGPTVEEWLGQATQTMLRWPRLAPALVCSTWQQEPEDSPSRQPSV